MCALAHIYYDKCLIDTYIRINFKRCESSISPYIFYIGTPLFTAV